MTEAQLTKALFKTFPTRIGDTHNVARVERALQRFPVCDAHADYMIVAAKSYRAWIDRMLIRDPDFKAILRLENWLANYDWLEKWLPPELQDRLIAECADCGAEEPEPEPKPLTFEMTFTVSFC